MTDLTRATIFVAAVAGVYLAAAAIAFRSYLQRNVPRSRSDRWITRIVFSLAALGIVCMAYGYFVEPYWLTVRHVQVRSGKLAGGSPVRIVLISDTHCDPKPRLEPRLAETIAAQKPDLILFAGDTINDPAALPLFKSTMQQISRLAPTYAVRGNWDGMFWSRLDVFGGSGAQELNVEPVRVTVRGSDIWIIGVPVGGLHKVDAALAQVPPGAFTLFMYHYPDVIFDAARRGIDLYLAGHTHGGQVALPLYGAIVTLSSLGKKFEYGQYRVDKTSMYVTRGIGMEGGPAPRVRFWAWPEIAVIELGVR